MQSIRKLTARAVFAAALMAGAAIPLGATQAATLINGSFEGSGDIGNFQTINAVDNSTIPGWTVASGSVDWIQNYWISSNGSRSLDLNGLAPGSISQTITGLTNGQQYEVTFDLAGNLAGGPNPKTLSVTASAGSNSYSFDASSTHLNAMGWVPESFFFTATGSSALLTFASTTTGVSGNGSYPFAFGPALDNVSVSATPLPAALPLFAGGLGVIGLLAKRRKRKVAAALAAA